MKPSLSLLLLDDDPEYHEIFSDIIDLSVTDRTVNFMAVATAAEALRVLGTEVIDVVFVDYYLGKVTGIEFMRDAAIIRASSAMVLLTGTASAETEKEAVAAGAVDFLSKDDLRPSLVARCIRYAEAIQQQRNHLVYALRQLQEAASAKTKFLSTMSHELRTPLNGVLGFADLLLSTAGTLPATSQVEYLRAIHDSGKRLEFLIDELLALRDPSDWRNLKLEDFCLDRVIGGLCNDFETVAGARNIEFNISLPPEGTRIETDRQTLILAIRPLVSNALKFTEAGGRVDISVAFQPELQVVVADTGIGMDGETLESAKEAFFQRDNSLARNYEGVGIGLTVAKNSTDLLGGKLAIKSILNEGTTITLDLPIRPL